MATLVLDQYKALDVHLNIQETGEAACLIERVDPSPAHTDSTQPKQDRRQALVRAAFNQIAERGFEGLRTREVAAEVGLNIATLHYYFPTKEALIGGVLEYAMRRFQSTLAPHGSSSDQLANHLRAVRDLLLDEPEVGTVMAELALRSTRDPQIAKILGSTNEGWQRIVRGLLHRAAREGHLGPEMDSDDVASLIVMVLMSMSLPTVASAARKGQALDQLERWLGIANSSQATD
ncbi:MAG TPA: TetR/AcrR family transcriptional regulator [Candidatus Dormibacteraeota bacterium]|nr:TetR/AcrR family transcriptional regulator [Candidatus Dormibacteraeota bacterium]